MNYYRTELYEDENYQRIYRTWLSVLINEIIPFIVVTTLNIMVIYSACNFGGRHKNVYVMGNSYTYFHIHAINAFMINMRISQLLAPFFSKKST